MLAILLKDYCHHMKFNYISSHAAIINPLADPRAARDARPLSASFFYFHAVSSKKKWPNNMLAPPLGMALTRLGNPGSATGVITARKLSLGLRLFVSHSVHMRVGGFPSMQWGRSVCVSQHAIGQGGGVS